MSSRKTYAVKTQAGIAYVTTNAHHSARAAKRALMWTLNELTDFNMVPLNDGRYTE